MEWPTEAPQRGELEATTDFDGLADFMWSLAEDLFPTHRSLLGEGYTRSLEILQKHLDFEVLTYPSGLQVFDWTIPPEWVIREAYVADGRGNRVIDIADCNLHVWGYSAPFSGMISREELQQHLHTMPEAPDAIQLRVTYYRRQWGFSVSQRQAERLTEPSYYVHIDSEFRPGHLRIGHLYLPGELKEEIVFDTYLCHPSLAEDNLSGVVGTVALMKALRRLPRRRYSYRMLIVPETIGPITFLSQNPGVVANIAAGLVLICLGGEVPVHYKKTLAGNHRIDRAVAHVLSHSGEGHRAMDYYVHPSSDENIFGGPGFRLPFGCFMRHPVGLYPEYHTSLDNLSFITKRGLRESVQILARVIDTLERDVVYRNEHPIMPFLTKHDAFPPSIFPRMVRPGDEQADARILYGLMMYIDGTASLLDIADRLGVPIGYLVPIVRLFEARGLIAPLRPGGV